MMDVFMDVLRQMVPLLGGVLTATRMLPTHLLWLLHTVLHFVGFILLLMAFGSLALMLVVWNLGALGITWLTMIMDRIAEKL
jgi:hypothetical protein